MIQDQPTCRPISGSRRRPAFAYRRLFITLAVVAALPAIAFSVLPEFSRSVGDAGPLMHKVERGEFIHDITERGELESANNVEIRCEVKALNTSGTTIIDIVPEGTLVKEGDIVCKLDSSSLENDRTLHQIAVANSEAELIRAQTVHDTAAKAREEYDKGTYKQMEQMAEAEKFLAEEYLQRAKEYWDYSKVLKDRGYITSSQLEADKYAYDKASKDLEAAETKLRVLQEYTHDKVISQLDSEIKAAKAKLEAQQHSNDLEKAKLQDIENQIEKCVIRAPSTGQVVYANITNGWGGREIIIEAGSSVRERQEIVRLPDHTKMQVKAKINEAKVALVMMGMAATVRLDAFPEMELDGVVEKVNEYAAPTSRYTSSAKEYETMIRLLEPPPGARPGLTAEVKIHLERLSDALQVPVQAIFEHGEKHYCVLRDNGGLRAQEVTIGSTNDKFVLVREGLQEGQEIVLNSTAMRDKVQLPELPPEGALRVAEKAPPAESEDQPGATGSRSNHSGLAGSDPAAMVEGILKQFDRNHDGRVELSDLPESIRSRFSAADSNGDGSLDRTELTASIAKVKSRSHGEKRRPGAGP